MRALLSSMLLLGLAVNVNVSAQTQTPAAPASPHKLTSNIYAEYYAEPQAEDPNVSEQSKYYGKQRGLMITTVSYIYDKTWAFTLAPEFRYNNGHQNGGYPTREGRVEYARSILSVMRKGILNEKDHGIGFEAGLVRRLFNKGVFPTNYGNYRFRTIFTKTVNDKFNAKLFNEVLYTAKPKDKRTNKDWLFIDNIRPTINWQITEKLSFMAEYDINVTFQEVNAPNYRRVNWTSENYNVLTYQINDAYSVGTTFKYNYFVQAKDNAIDQNLEISPNVAYSWSPGNMVQFELGFNYNEAHDNQSGFKPKKNFHQYPNFVVYYMQTLF